VCVRVITSHRGTIDKVFVSTAARYWIGVFPFVCREIRNWERAARIIPDPELRTLALKALHDERGNLEGAAAYAAFTPRKHRLAVARAAIAFQAVYDYVDMVSEQPGSRHPSNIIGLHQALRVALDPGARHPDYYAHHCGDDGGYLNRLVDRCRTALRLLPSLQLVAAQMQRAATRIVTYQHLNHGGSASSHRAFARWACKETVPGSGLRWWETGAAAGSSLSVFAMISAAAQPILDARRVAALDRAYFPWIGSIHTLLDSLIDEDEDAITAQHCLIAHYTSQEETASRLQVLAEGASAHTKTLPDGEHHMMIFAAMVCFYLASPQGRDPRVGVVTEGVLKTLGDHALPSMLVLRARHTLRRLAKASSDRRSVVR
jgi:tetraprenyl-beta-curcumene synthase